MVSNQSNCILTIRARGITRLHPTSQRLPRSHLPCIFSFSSTADQALGSGLDCVWKQGNSTKGKLLATAHRSNLGTTANNFTSYPRPASTKPDPPYDGSTRNKFLDFDTSSLSSLSSRGTQSTTQPTEEPNSHHTSTSGVTYLLLPTSALWTLCSFLGASHSTKPYGRGELVHLIAQKSSTRSGRDQHACSS